MRKIMVAVFLTLLFSSFVFSQSARNEKNKREITVCKIELTDEGKTASFHFNYIYFLDTDEIGEVKKIKQLHQDNPKFVQDGKIMDCMKMWKMKPNKTYSVTFAFGTNSQENFILILDSEEKIKFIL